MLTAGWISITWASVPRDKDRITFVADAAYKKGEKDERERIATQLKGWSRSGTHIISLEAIRAIEESK